LVINDLSYLRTLSWEQRFFRDFFDTAAFRNFLRKTDLRGAQLEGLAECEPGVDYLMGHND